MVALMARPPARGRREDPVVSVRVVPSVSAPRGAGVGAVFRYEIELDASQPQDERLIARLLEVAARMPEGRRRQLAEMPLPDAVELIDAALPMGAGTDELLGPFYDSRGLSDRWGISVQAVHKRAGAHRLLKVITRDGVALYPAFQFDPRGGLLPHLPAVFDAFAPHIQDTWSIAAWLNAPNQRLDGGTPAHLLREGRAADVLKAAAVFAGRLAA